MESTIRERLGACALCAGGVMVPHIPCLVLMALSSVSVTAAAFVANPYAVGALSVVAARGGYIFWRRRRGTVSLKGESLFMKFTCTALAVLMIVAHAPWFGAAGHIHH